MLPAGAPSREPAWLGIAQKSSVVILLTITAISAGLFLRALIANRRSGDGAIHLKDPPDVKTRKGLFSRVLLHNIEDMGGDGEPIDLPAFWSSVVPGLRVLLLMTAVQLGLLIYNIMWLSQSTKITAWLVVGMTAEGFSGLYLLFIAVRLLLNEIPNLHAKLLYHACSISAVAFCHWYLITFGNFLVFPRGHRLSNWSDYAILGFWLLTMLTSAAIRTGPALRADITDLYNNSVSRKLKEAQADSQGRAFAPVNGEVSSSILGRLFFSFSYPVIRQISGMDQIDIQDLPAAHAYFRTQNILHESVLPNDASGVRSSFDSALSLLYTVWYPERLNLLKAFIYLVVLCPLWYLPHFCLQQLLYGIDHIEARQPAIGFAVLFVIARILNLLVELQRYNLMDLYAGPRITTHSAFLIYQKILTRNAYAAPEKGDKRTGKAVLSKADILNLISSDTAALADIGWGGVQLLGYIIEMVLGCFYVWTLLGPSGLVGLATLALTFPPAYFLTKLEYRVFEKRLSIRDERFSLMQETVQAISMIKMMATERFWYNRINEVRSREFKRLIQAHLLGALSGLLYTAAPTMVVIVAFAHYTLVAKQHLTASIAFTSIAVFDQLRPALTQIPTSIASLLQDFLSAKRIGQFLKARDVDYLLETSSDAMAIPKANEEIFIRGSITWDQRQTANAEPTSNDFDGSGEAPMFHLRDLDISFPRARMTLIAGKFGSGKSLLLLALLGEARLVEGDISYLLSEVMDPNEAKEQEWGVKRTSVAFVPQIAWLQSMSIRDNILFGLPMYFERYRAVIHAVGLLPDLQVLDDADLTEIGERGKILSGGQKARVSLARAVYSRASVLLLDDVISAVDAQTSKHIVEHCFQSPLMAGRTIIIASHAVETLGPLADHAIFLGDGKAIWTGSGKDLLESEHMEHLKASAPSNVQDVDEESQSKENLEDDRNDIVDKSDADDMNSFEIKEQVPKTPKQLIKEESRGQNNLDLKLWKDLARSSGGKVFWSCAVTLLFNDEFWNYVLGSETRDDSHTVVFWVALYSSLSLAVNVLNEVFELVKFFGGVRALKRIHSEMLESVLRSRMSFFSKTRAGSIIQRFGQDLNETLTCYNTIGSLSETLLNLLINIVTVSVKGGWIFGLMSFLLLVGVWKPGTWFRRASTQVRRLEAIIPGPINALYGETVAGTAVIRAFGQQSVFVNKLNMKINNSAWRNYIARWFYINLRIFDVTLNTTALALIFLKADMTGATAGFMLVFASNITWNVNWVFLMLRQVELKGVSLERTSEYRILEREEGSTLNPESSSYISEESNETLESWPERGDIEVDGLRARYGPDMPDILHGVSFCVKAGQRVGIVGATGGGKSTLAKAFFSFVEITGGSIKIDGIDISQIPLSHLRSKLGIIAQDPVLLSGTLRLNLDIEGRYSDEELYDALHQVQLLTRESSRVKLIDDGSEEGSAAAESSASSTSGTLVGAPTPKEEGQKNIFANLDSEIKSGGENLSAGQKQLVVLARALLKKHKALILDEATASIDSATDAEISRVVHEEFTDATVLIIAHRLRTIMSCAKILVMDKGNLVQQGSPFELIKQDGGRFQALCRAAGPKEYHHLMSLAEQSAETYLL